MVHCRGRHSLLAVHLDVGTIALLGLHMVHIGRSIALQAAVLLSMHRQFGSEHPRQRGKLWGGLAKLHRYVFKATIFQLRSVLPMQ